ncbi:MAG: hypothetical protein Q4F33_06165 [Mycoplasmatota bacterium]|nr:hypothetical protein [Mycoplasmatota bacterium]
MKRRIASILATIALIVTGTASLGCFLWMAQEPSSFDLFND